MFLIYGKRTLKIKKYEDYSVRCNNCKSYSIKYSVYINYYHFFFIPVYPIGLKTVKTQCLNCNDTFNDEKVNHYLSITKTPIYLYTIPLIILSLFIVMMLTNINNQKKKAQYIKDPRVGDVYRIRQEIKKETIYHFEKVIRINSDTLRLLNGALQYNNFVPEMNQSDYFVKDVVYILLKSDLQKHQDSGHINFVIRDYKLDSRFRVEK